MNSGTVCLIRHGQAGSRQNYDELSALGVEQSKLLGEYFSARGIHFQSVISGGLQRQRQTAALACGAFSVDPRWSEFDLDDVYRGIAPRLADEDEGFAREYAALQLEMMKQESRVHRHWTASDISVFRAWCDGRFTFDGESFAGFCARVREARDGLANLPRPAAVFTSATPIALVLGWAAGIHELETMQYAGVMLNSAFTLLELSDDGLRVESFNNVPHLSDERLRTRR